MRLDASSYDDAVSLYLSSVQYIDWVELGPETALERIVAQVKHPFADTANGIEYLCRASCPQGATIRSAASTRAS